MNEIKSISGDLIVVKRSGQRVEFNSTKIVVAIKKAFDQVRPTNSEKEINKTFADVLNYINTNYIDRKTINVEDIQDIIETKLKENNFSDVYETFSDYRIRRATFRKAFAQKQQHKFARAVERIGDFKKDATSNELLLDFGKTISCEYTKAFILDNKYVRAHEEGNIYIHNLDYFNLGKLSSCHPLFKESINDDFPNGLILEALNIKSEIDGEICIDSFDELLVPLAISKFKQCLKATINNYLKITDFIEFVNIRKIDELIDKQNSIYFDINIFDQFTLNRKTEEIFIAAYNDSFNYINTYLSTSIETILKSLNSNHLENKLYSISLGSDNSLEGALISNIYFDVLNKINYLSNLNTIFKIHKDSQKELINKVCVSVFEGKNISIANINSTYNSYKTEYFSDGKRIFEDYLGDKNYSSGKMIVSTVSLNMARLGLKYENKNINDFYLALDGWLELSKNCLVSIFEIIGDKCKENYTVLFRKNIIDDDKLDYGQKIRKVIKKGVLNLGLVGLSECALNLTKDKEKAKELLIDIIKHIKESCIKYSKEEKLNFMVSETSKLRPSKKLIELDKSMYGLKEKITDKPNYSRIDSLFAIDTNQAQDFNYIGKYQNLLTGGNLVTVKLAKKRKMGDILNVINQMIKFDVGFIKFEGEELNYDN